MTNSLQPAYALVPGANLEAYVHTVNSIPLLTPEQERELAESLYYEQDLGAARQMVLATCDLSYTLPVAIPATVWLRLT